MEIKKVEQLLMGNYQFGDRRILRGFNRFKMKHFFDIYFVKSRKCLVKINGNPVSQKMVGRMIDIFWQEL